MGNHPNYVICRRFSTTVRRTKWDREKQYTVLLKDVTITGDIQLTIDVEALMRRLAPQALRSKGRKSKLAGGIIVAKASSVTETPNG